MKEYLLIFRADSKAIEKVSQEETQDRNNSWMDWINWIDAQGKLAKGGNHLCTDGIVLHSNGLITEGPFTEIKESILGYILINAESYVTAVEMAKACPILAGEDTSVEIREIGSF
ncbi:MAG: YciI family protein [bacterium]